MIMLPISFTVSLAILSDDEGGLGAMAARAEAILAGMDEARSPTPQDHPTAAKAVRNAIQEDYDAKSVRISAWQSLAKALRKAIAKNGHASHQVTFHAPMEALLEDGNHPSMARQAWEEGDKHRDSSAGHHAAWHKLADAILDALGRHQAIRTGDLVRRNTGDLGIAKFPDGSGTWTVFSLNSLDGRCFETTPKPWHATEIVDVVHVADSKGNRCMRLALVKRTP